MFNFVIIVCVRVCNYFFMSKYVLDWPGTRPESFPPPLPFSNKPANKKCLNTKNKKMLINTN